MHSREGSPAEAFELQDTDGNVHRLSDYAGRWLLLVFHRHLGWLPCREHLSQLRQREDEINSLGIDVLIITFEFGAVAQAYVRDTNLTWPLLVDESRSLYEAYGMTRGSWRQILGPAAWWEYAKLLARGRKLKRSSGDVRQLGGDVLIDRVGIVHVHHVGDGPADRPSVASLLDVVRNQTAMSADEN